MRHIIIPAVILSAALLPAAGRANPSSVPPKRPLAVRSVWDSVYTADQATRGQVSYNQTCARCHLQSLSGADESPALVGTNFLGNWNGVKLDVLFERIRTAMPQDDPGTLGRQLIADVMAYLLKVNGFPAGTVELPKETDILKDIKLEASKP